MAHHSRLQSWYRSRVIKAVIYEQCDPPEVLRLTGIPKPVPKDNEVLVKVQTTVMTIDDTIMCSLNIPGPRWQRYAARL